MKKYYRGVMYCIGLVILALGIILNTKTGLGVSPIISIPYCISKIWKLNLGDITMYTYILYVVLQMVLRRRKFRSFDLLQIPMSIIFTRVINVFNDKIIINNSSFVMNLILLMIAIMLTAIGVVITVEMKFVPNAADGLAQAMAEAMNKNLGLAKNILDIFSVIITIGIGMFAGGKIIGIGLGTVLAVIGVGRAISLFNMLFKNKLVAIAS
ncbi:DUF6198 family protein [Clostridium saccharobutylicum]|uniref:Uncharacterized protein n=1 Tax=Clostridium saccharobutylicum DSM 13864 TaxID=1345695 RepID=U5MV54_CLOSA|nr:DUF6198 family protein [Clostridium saccharobutylicum]AGX44684.1 hypothetical protein CLSA_c37230 [Clostridium saccharobutylicum DSM 13864]AQR91973.1 hypothetical protein CLOSC_37010 [Clostridium saccharobutylicum]AQS01875.1 hypothetical protein CSACC_37060 [Clostridium saccharobutylicum]AQS11473.1 hypothetical protein CLOBY_36290 [Clostridium saccharobutylicum]AQS15858.1 hypothetical protein CLOSACC_37060 [Clostridium saccharobutylicum]